MYNDTKARVESNVKEHNEKYKDQYDWVLETDDKEKHIVSTRIYDMSGITSGEGHQYESEYHLSYCRYIFLLHLLLFQL